MIGVAIENPFPVFFDSNQKLLENGYIYIGTAGLNAEVHPIDVFWDKDFLYPAAQPIRTINGMPARGGTPAAVFIKLTAYSITVKNKNENIIYSTSDYLTLGIPADDSITVAMYTAAAYPVLLVGPQTIAGPKTLLDNPIITNAGPYLELLETGVTVDNAKWQLRANAEQLVLRVGDNAGIIFTNIFIVNRAGTTVTLFNILSTALQHNGVDIYASIDEDDMVSDSAVRVPTQQSTKAYVDNQDHTSGYGVQIPTAGLADNAVTAAKINTATTGSSSGSIGAGVRITPAVGAAGDVGHWVADDATVVFQVNVFSAWQGTGPLSGIVFFDGTNMSFINNDSSSHNYYIQEF